MSKWIIINRNDLSVANLAPYESDYSRQSEWGGPWGDVTSTVHLSAPSGFEPGDCDVEATGTAPYDFIILTGNLTKREARFEAELTTARDTLKTQVKDKLSEVDFIFTRHQEQLKLVEEELLVSTKLTEEEYISALSYKQSLRGIDPDTMTLEQINAIECPGKPACCEGY